MQDYQVEFHQRIADFSPEEWNALVTDNNPFVRHEFLDALERHKCVSAEFGWIPHHIGIRHDGQLIAVMPLYEKHNSYGEFVFDHSWADAWQRVGLPYFPKLVTSVPYSPVAGPRFLISHRYCRENLQSLIVQQVQTFALTNGFSGWHFLFANESEQSWLSNQDDFYTRHDCHFHWFNRQYTYFNDFLNALTAKKRKNIKQERKSIEKAGINLRVLDGHTASDEDWHLFSHFYYKTFTEKWSTPTLNEGFFKSVAKALPEQTVLVMADDVNGRCIAGALMYRSDSVLFGRHWGCIEEIKNLHFEACYYQGIEYAIQHKLERFEPGAGGEHKIARGFIPVETMSSHWVSPNPFPEGLAQFVVEERNAIENYMAECMEHSPYKE